MTTIQPRYSKEEFARRGDEVYQSQIRAQVEEGNDGKIVAIDIETAAFEVADNTILQGEAPPTMQQIDYTIDTPMLNPG
jgi:hypothetical protein